MLRLEPSDPAVRERIAAAVRVSNEHRVKPTLTIRCAKCRTSLALVGDVPDYGPLFAASWPVASDDGVKVLVNGAELRDHQRAQWMTQHYETLAESGRPMDVPLRHIVIALLRLPDDAVQDYPDLLLRCPRHGDYLADRLDVLKALRANPDGLAGRLDVRKGDYLVTLTGRRLDYAIPTGEHLLTGVKEHRAVTRRLKADVMDVAEFEARLARRRKNVRDL